jgi:SAM-dependent methyltransferase
MKKNFSRIYDFYSDLKYGVKTGEAFKNEPTPYFLLNRIFNSLPIDVPSDWNFVDYGCGLGRVLGVAHKKGFKKLFGVDTNAEFLRRAEGNLKNKSIQFYHQSAGEPLVLKGKTIHFFFNPFNWDIMERVAENILALEGEHLLVYVNPAYAKGLKAMGFQKIPCKMKNFIYSVELFKEPEKEIFDSSQRGAQCPLVVGDPGDHLL